MGNCWSTAATWVLVGLQCFGSVAHGGKRASSVQPIFNDGEVSHPDCPSGTHLIAKAASKENIENADSMAKAKVVRQIRNHIEVMSERVVTIQKGRGTDVNATDYSNVTRQKSIFDYGELIHIVDREKHRGWHMSIACLSRTQAADAIRRDNGPRLADFSRRLSEALQTAANGNDADFVGAFSGASSGYQELKDTFLTLSALDGAPDSRMGEFASLNGHATVVRARRSVGVSPPSINLDGRGLSMSDEYLEQIGTEVASVVGRVAHSVDVKLTKDPGCEGGLVSQVSLEGEVLCERGRRGYRCGLSLNVESNICDGTNMGRVISIPNSKLQGRPGGSLQQAEKRLIRRLQSSPVFRKAVLESLGAITPLNYSGG